MRDVADPQMYLAGAAAILDEYPQAVRNAMADPRSGTRLLKPYPSLHDIRDACDKAYEPIERQRQRQRATESHQLALAAPSKPTQQERDEQIRDYETRIKPLLSRTLQPIVSAPIEKKPDGNHTARVMEDMARRKAEREAKASSAA